MVKQISDNEIYLLIKCTKSVLWKVAKRLSYIQDARCLRVNEVVYFFLLLYFELGGNVRGGDKLAFVWGRFIILPPVPKFLHLRRLFLCFA